MFLLISIALRMLYTLCGLGMDAVRSIYSGCRYIAPILAACLPVCSRGVMIVYCIDVVTGLCLSVSQQMFVCEPSRRCCVCTIAMIDDTKFEIC